ncbi:Stp1/IreP family PP2C-type Ser/Thr phosphatase [Candidatus Gracilibacteria bacterium]|nr:Stp1/IreP family PP2C-type Ser/Thr phosphatase [Candidatus Gracilibacteria bacterium]
MLAVSARFCSRCGARVVPEEPDEILVSTGRRLRISSDALSVRELMAVVEAGVYHWQQRLSDAGVDREQAAAAIGELSRILQSLSAQLAQGRETMRITARLPAQREYTRACPFCGRGNRANARFCISCGASLVEGAAASQPPVRPPRLRLTIAARTDVGRTRTNNEDSYFRGEFAIGADAFATLLIVADGMGGAQAGEVASQLAIATIKQELTGLLAERDLADDADWQAVLREAMIAANRAVFEHARRNKNRQGMGTTLTMALIHNDRLHLAHVGDSRAYLINAQGVSEGGAVWSLLTSDHTLVARLVDIGQLTPDQARVHPQRNILYRSLGTDPQTEVDTASHPIERGDHLLLCSDGLDTHVADEELARIVLEYPQVDRTCQALVDLANERGGRDNITVLIARVE